MTSQQAVLKNSNKAWVASWLLCLVFILSSFPFSAAQAEQKEKLVYEVYAGGIHAVQASVDVNFGHNGRYDIFLSARTRGFLGALAPWEGTFETHGWTTENGYKPELHKSVATWRDETEIKEYKYNSKGGFEGLLITDHDKPTYKKEVEDELTQGTIDALTASMLVMQEVAAGKDCNGSSEVFDGKRRFEQVFVHKKNENLKTSKYNIYEGPAAVCTVEVKPISGAWHKKPRGWLSIQEQGRKRGTMPTVWMGKLREDGPAVPVKIFIKTAYGALYMHLAEYSNGEEIIVAEKRVTEDEE